MNFLIPIPYKNNFRRRTNDIRRKTSDIILKEQVTPTQYGLSTYAFSLTHVIQRFRDEQLNYLHADRQYKKEKSKIIGKLALRNDDVIYAHQLKNTFSDSVEQEYAKNAVKYNPWGKPGKHDVIIT